jgi:hypothetical protein
VRPQKFQEGDLVTVYDNCHDRKTFKKFLPKQFGPYMVMKVFITTHMNWLILMGRSMVRSTMTSLNIFILLKPLLQGHNNKISEGIDVTTK